MPKTLYKISTSLIIALGSVHVLFTIPAYGRWTLNAMWFAGSGLAIVFAGFLNLALLRAGGSDGVVRLLCLFTNLLVALLFTAALSLLTEPQVYLGLALFIFETVGVLMLGRADGATAGKDG
ncbi:MAG TPA: hypothetical protein VE842_17080 [Pyrinomonadaceae bacterium]|jgi:hypothetical protein|nr:hypothetical protein [Pyrinomonadaceae bacterium]